MLDTEALVDTGAMHLVIPQPLADQLALVGLRSQAVTMADGRDGVYPQTEPVTVELLGRSYALSALVMGATVLLGAMVLEGLDLGRGSRPARPDAQSGDVGSPPL